MHINRPSPSHEPQDCAQPNVFYCQASHWEEGNKEEATASRAAKDGDNLDLRVGQACQTESKVPTHLIWKIWKTHQFHNGQNCTHQAKVNIYGMEPASMISNSSNTHLIEDSDKWTQVWPSHIDSIVGCFVIIWIGEMPLAWKFSSIS